MSLSREMKRNLTMQQEGTYLGNVATYGIGSAADLARCAADGAVNALIRMEGAEATAPFVFALSDRVAGGVRAPTAIFLLTPNPVEAPSDKQVVVQVTPPQTRMFSFWTIFSTGMAIGALAMWLVMSGAPR